MSKNDEIKIVEDWRVVWWDRQEDVEFLNSVTGAIVHEMLGNRPRLEQRRVQNIFGREVHVLDGGLIETRWITTWEGSKAYSTFWKECSLCHKKFDIGEL